MANPIRHVKKKRLRDLNNEIYRIKLRMHNKKAKRDIPRLQSELNALFKAKDETMRNNMPDLTRKVGPLRLCPICNERFGKGYHICKHMPGKRTPPRNTTGNNIANGAAS